MVGHVALPTTSVRVALIAKIPVAHWLVVHDGTRVVMACKSKPMTPCHHRWQRQNAIVIIAANAREHCMCSYEYMTNGLFIIPTLLRGNVIFAALRCAFSDGRRRIWDCIPTQRALER